MEGGDGGFGFIALVPRWILKWGSEWDSLPTHLGPGVGAQVASLRSPILRPGRWEVYCKGRSIGQRLFEDLVPLSL